MVTNNKVNNKVNNRDCLVIVRLSAGEVESIRIKADELALTPAVWLRMLALQSVPGSVPGSVRSPGLSKAVKTGKEDKPLDKAQAEILAYNEQVATNNAATRKLWDTSKNGQ